MTPRRAAIRPSKRELRRSTTFHESYKDSTTQPTTRRELQPSTAFQEVYYCHHRRSSSAVAISVALAILLVKGEGVGGADMTTDYLKPSISSKECVDTVELITAKTEALGNDGACMQCDPANNVSESRPPRKLCGCQLIGMSSTLKMTVLDPKRVSWICKSSRSLDSSWFTLLGPGYYLERRSTTC